MLKLFKFSNYKLEISEEAFVIDIFKKIWNRDKTKNKEIAIGELGYVYHYIDPRSDYSYITNDLDRSQAIIEGEGLKNWKPDSLIKEAIEYYDKFLPTSTRLVKSCKIAITKACDFLENVDLYATDNNGKPLYGINTIVNAIKQVPMLTKALQEAEEALNKEIQNTSKIRGNKEKKILEDM